MRGIAVIAVAFCLCFAAQASTRPAAFQSPAKQPAFDDLVASAKGAMMGDPARALEFARAAEKAAGLGADSTRLAESLATSLWLQAEALTRINKAAEARPLITRGLALATSDHKTTKLDGDLNMALARVANLKGEPELALKSFQAAYNIFTAMGEARSQSMALQGLGSIYSDARDYEHVLEYYSRASKAFSGDPTLEMSAANNIGNALKEMGRFDEALVDFERALAISTKLNSPLLQARILTNIASLHSQRGDLAAADKACDRALQLLGPRDDSGWSNFVWGVKAELDYKRGAFDQALADLAKAFQGVDLKTSTAPYRDLHEIAYKIHRDRGNATEALAHHEAFKRLDDQGRSVSASANLALMGARFDFATQQLEINKLKTQRLERDVALAKTESTLRISVMGSVLIIALLVIVWTGWRYFSLHKHRNEINAANVKLLSTVEDLNGEIARRKQTEDELREAKNAAEQANRAKSQFLANMSHELRTPLNAIIGFAEIMSKEVLGPVGTPTYRQYADDIFQSGTHLSEVMSDILDMARVDAGRIEVSESDFDLNGAIDDALRPFAEDERNAAKSISFERIEPSPVLHADERLTRQILVNLISNAMKYTRDDGRVEVRVERSADKGLDLVVEDDGIGIPEEKFTLIMEPFGQVEDAFARSKGGVGLGLPLVKALAELQGARFTIASKVGAGTTARVHFPAERVVRMERRIAVANA